MIVGDTIIGREDINYMPSNGLSSAVNIGHLGLYGANDLPDNLRPTADDVDFANRLMERVVHSELPRILVVTNPGGGPDHRRFYKRHDMLEVEGSLAFIIGKPDLKTELGDEVSLTQHLTWRDQAKDWWSSPIGYDIWTPETIK